MKKVFELAKELNISAIDLVEKLKSLGFNVRNHMVSLSDEEVEAALRHLDEFPPVAHQRVKVRKKVIKKVVKKFRTSKKRTNYSYKYTDPDIYRAKKPKLMERGHEFLLKFKREQEQKVRDKYLGINNFDVFIERYMHDFSGYSVYEMQSLLGDDLNSDIAEYLELKQKYLPISYPYYRGSSLVDDNELMGPISKDISSIYQSYLPFAAERAFEKMLMEKHISYIDLNLNNPRSFADFKIEVEGSSYYVDVKAACYLSYRGAGSIPVFRRDDREIVFGFISTTKGTKYHYSTHEPVGFFRFCDFDDEDLKYFHPDEGRVSLVYFTPFIEGLECLGDQNEY